MLIVQNPGRVFDNNLSPRSQNEFVPYHKLSQKLSFGAFGQIIQAQDLVRNLTVVVKIGLQDKDNESILKESKILKHLQGIEGVPRLYSTGETSKQNNYFSMQMLQIDLSKLAKKQQGRLSLKNILNLGIQLTEILQKIHEKGVLHRDIKPENIMIGSDESGQQRVYLVDFGISKMECQYMIESNHRFIGTIRYASIGAHLGKKITRKDDLEMLLYTLIYLFNGNLPWQSTVHINKIKMVKKIGNAKQNVDIQQMCQKLPKEFSDLLIYVRSIGGTEIPDYNRIKNSFQIMMKQSNNSLEPYDLFNKQDSDGLKAKKLNTKNSIFINTERSNERLSYNNWNSQQDIQSNYADLLIFSSNRQSQLTPLDRVQEKSCESFITNIKRKNQDQMQYTDYSLMTQEESKAIPINNMITFQNQQNQHKFLYLKKF